MVRQLGGIALLAAFLLPIAAGCGSSGSSSKMSHLSGKVLFKGEPVPAGFITFMPDAAKGNSGNARVAQIKDGVYDTSVGPEPGIYSGPTVIRIAGFDGKKIPNFYQGKQIFNAYEIREIVADGTGKKDFAVPESAAANLKIVRTSDN